MANANIFQQYLQPARSVVDYSNDYAKADAIKNQNALQALTLRQASAVDSQKNALRAAVQGGLDLTSDAGQSQALSIAPDVAPGLLKTVQDNITAKAAAQKDLGAANASNASAAATTQGVDQKNYTQAMQKVLSFQSPADAAASLNNAVKDGRIDMQHASLLINSMPQNDPQAFDAWKRQWAIGISDPAKMAEFLAPHIEKSNIGGSTVTQAIDPVTLKPTTVSTMQNSVSPDAQLQAQTSRANTAATIAKDYKVAGLDANGNIAPLAGVDGGSSSPLQGLVDSIGQYKVPENVALARVPAAQRAQILAAVQQKYSDYDPSTYAARQKAARDFSTGQQGNAMRSFAVAGQHLDQLAPLVQALDNGNNQTVNMIGNAIAAWNGGTAPTNFDAAKDVVSKEVVKAIVGSGGGVSERGELAEQLSKAKSPQQLLGVIQQYRGLMGAQHEALLAQRRGAGVPDSTLPNYGGAPAAAATAPSGWSYLGPVGGSK